VVGGKKKSGKRQRLFPVVIIGSAVSRRLLADLLEVCVRRIMAIEHGLMLQTLMKKNMGWATSFFARPIPLSWYLGLRFDRGKRGDDSKDAKTKRCWRW
jgi:hypothetical protein